MGVNRCVCHDLPFTRLLALAREQNLNFEQLRDLTKCSTGCAMCEPYVRRLLATGDADQFVMSPTEAAHWTSGPRPSK